MTSSSHVSTSSPTNSLARLPTTMAMSSGRRAVKDEMKVIDSNQKASQFQ